MVRYFKDDIPEPYGWIDSEKYSINTCITMLCNQHHESLRQKYPYYYADTGVPVDGLPEIVIEQYRCTRKSIDVKT